MKFWWLRLAHYARPHHRGLAWIVVVTLLGTALDLLGPWPLKLIVDNVLTHQPLPTSITWLQQLPRAASDQGLLVWLAAGVVLLFLIRELTNFWLASLTARVGYGMRYDLGARLLERLQYLSLSFHARHQAGDLVKRVISDSNCVRDLMMGAVLPVLSALLSLVAMLGVMVQLNLVLSLVALVTIPLLVVLIPLFNRPMMQSTYRHETLEGEVMASAEQTLSALPVVQAFGREPLEDHRFGNLLALALQTYRKAMLWQVLFGSGVGSITALGRATILLVGGYLVVQGKLSVGSLLVFLSYLGSLYAPLSALVYSSSGFATAAAGARRVFEALDAEIQVKEARGAPPLARTHEPKHIRFEDVGFGYEEGRPILHGINLEVKAGEVVAIVGSTGAGKSTLVSLLLRFFDPWQGRVLLDGVDIREVQLKSLRSGVALVLQEPFLLPMSIAENIAYGDPTASPERIIAAAKTANAHSFIERLPEGYDTVIGERGSTLSGGEKQRIAIARALLKDAPILILDEPTSALDAQTEASLMEALERLMEGRTTFIIAHRLSTIKGADRIVVLEQGRMVEVGSHQELMGHNDLYKKLYDTQMGMGAI
jgi:ATP-binding cassette subfamily B protein/subfamily B ATP-binding cassette protein MsbA